MRAFLYARVSTADKGQDVENQLPEMREYCRRQGWEVQREFVDKASASGRQRREAFENLLRACERGGPHVVLIWSLDRFSREGPLKTLLLIDRLARGDVRIKSMREPWLDPDSPTYELLLPIFAWIARQESIRLGERVRAGMARARENGARFGRPRHGVPASRIARLRQSGASLRAIGRQVGVSEASVRRSLKMAGKRGPGEH